MNKKQWKHKACIVKDMSLIIESKVNQKWKNKICKLNKVEERISILQLDPQAKYKTKAKQRYESRKIVLNQELGSKLN